MGGWVNRWVDGWVDGVLGNLNDFLKNFFLIACISLHY